ncbi:hypothetical protein JW916_01310 [Candidatus Sumerlaeota bacterium]|nr:hypothetical protein [Candidatus Sumerlaeota bacterium]
MNERNLSARIFVCALILLLCFIAAPSLADPLGSAFTYQGQLTEGGIPANGSYDFRFRLFDAPSAGTQIGSTLTIDAVSVTGGVFTVTLDFGPDAFDGSARFLRVQVRPHGTTTFTGLDPRQELRPVPHALSTLWSGLSGAGPSEMITSNTAYGVCVQNDAAGDGIRSITKTASAVYASFYGANTGTGTCVYGYSSAGKGVWGISGTTYGVEGESTSGFGVRAGGNDGSLYDAFGDLVLGGIRGEIFAENGPINLFSQSNVLVDLDDDNNDGDSMFRVLNGADGIAFTVFESGNVSVPGDLSIGGNLTAGGSKAGYVVDIAQNDDTVALEAGDVVAVCGSGPPVLGGIPIVKVRRATASEAGAVVGVVDRAFHPEPQSPPPDAPGAAKGEAAQDANSSAAPMYSATPIPPGGYCSIVTLGSFKTIKVDASSGAIRPGDRLTPSSHAGFAMKTVAPAPGTVVGKAMGSLDFGVGAIPVLVTLH